MRRWRKMTWALWAWSILVVVWAVTAGGSADCANSDKDLASACEAGTGLGILLILFIGFIGFVFLAIIWLMTRPRTKSCPSCGEDVRKGRMECASCGYRFGSSAPSVASSR